MSKQVELYVPLLYNDGTAIDAQTRIDEQAFLAKRFGGCTVIHDCNGWGVRPAWYNEKVGLAQREPVEIWRVIVDEYDPTWWAWYKENARQMYEQEAFLITVTDVEIIP